MFLRLSFPVFLLCLSLSAFSQTFSGGGGSIPDDGNAVTFDIPVSGLPNSLDTVSFGIERVCINITHQWIADLAITLRAPDGTILSLVSGVGGDTDGFVNTCLSGNATTSIFEVWYPFTGEFRPFGDMGALNNGQNPNGVWQLRILDTYAFADAGDLIDWSITFGDDPCKPFPFVSSDLPIVKIQTGGQTIPNDPKIDALMTIIDNGPGQRNFVDQNDVYYSGPVGIELRGNSSQGMPKKSYNFEFRDDEGEDKDVEIMNLPAGSDFALAANFSDKTLMRNALAYETFRQMGHYAARTRFCELILDNTYQGIYILTEEIRRDNERLDIARLRAEDTTGVDLTGGYIVRIDWNRTPGWNSQFSQPNSPNIYTYFQHEYPRWDALHPAQQNYIRSYLDSFEVVLHGSQFQSPETGWRNFGEEKTFLDYLILNELSKNVDGYRLSTYFHKDRDDRGGKLQMGPPWDYDLAWYNADYCDNFNTAGWAFDINYVCQDAGVPFWWERLMDDTLFRQNLACRWQDLRASTLSNSHFFSVIDSMAGVLDEAQERNFRFWPILGKYVWPNPGPLPDTYAGEVEKMKTWISQRFQWLDFSFGQGLPQLDAGFIATPVSGLNWQFNAVENPQYEYFWDFGDGSTADTSAVQHTFPGSGTYVVTLQVATPFGCRTESDQIIHIIGVGTQEAKSDAGFYFYPSPVSDVLHIRMPEEFPSRFILRLYNVLGEKVMENELESSGRQASTSMSGLTPGVYTAEIQTGGKRVKAEVLIKI